MFFETANWRKRHFVLFTPSNPIGKLNMCYELISSHAKLPPLRGLLQTLLLHFLDSSSMACVCDKYLMLTLLWNSALLSAPQTMGEVCHK